MLARSAGISEGLLAGSCGQLADKMRRQMYIIRTSGARLLALINDVMDAAALRNHKLVLKQETVRGGPPFPRRHSTRPPAALPSSSALCLLPLSSVSQQCGDAECAAASSLPLKNPLHQNCTFRSSCTPWWTTCST